MQQLSVALFASASVLVALAVVAVALRLYVRIFMIKSVGIDDYLIVVALVFYIVAESMLFNSTSLAGDKNITELLEVITPATRSIYFGEVFYVLTVWALKLSIGTFLLRLVTQNKIQRYTIYAVMLVTGLYYTAYFFMVIFQCTPVQRFWLPLSKGHCIPSHTNTITSFVHAALTGVSDLIFAGLPVFIVWKLQMNRAMKISVAGLLGLGAIGGITTFVRMPYVKALEEATPFDFFVVTSRLAVWTGIEPGVGIIIGSVATLRPIFKRILGGSEVFTSRGSNHGRSLITGSKYLRSDSSSHQLDTFTDANKKAGFTTTMVKGSVTKNGKLWTENESEEELNRGLDNFKDVERGIQRTVAFESVSESRHTVTPTQQEPFSTRGGFY